jgi:hypothetical protein
MLSLSSYYDGLNNFLKKSNKEEKVLQITRLFEKESFFEKYSPSNICDKIKDDIPKLERYIKDDKYRKKLLHSLYLSQEYHELFDILGLEKLVKEKIGIPENATIKYEKVKCSNDCIHNHKYFYGYYWDSTMKKLKKKYIGKELPEPFKFKITYSIE